MATVLKAEALKKEYPAGDVTVRAVRGVDLEIEEGTFYAILGRSGSGKSTLLHLLSGFDEPTSGRVLVDGQDIHRMKDTERAAFRRRKIGFVFQAYHLLPEFCAEENVRMPLFLDHARGDDAYLAAVFRHLGIQDKLLKYPSQLSGGEQQRVAIARALAAKPRLVFADEPTGNLDRDSSREVMELLLHTRELFHQTIVLVTHDREAAQYADVALTLQDGQIVSEVGR
ncbi:MAG: ABC transporter ATP-binding protein [Oscillospiraceae bacterium]